MIQIETIQVQNLRRGYIVPLTNIDPTKYHQIVTDFTSGLLKDLIRGQRPFKSDFRALAEITSTAVEYGNETQGGNGKGIIYLSLNPETRRLVVIPLNYEVTPEMIQEVQTALGL